MLLPWLLAALALTCAAEPGSSLRGAVEALQRRQRGPARAPLPDYDALYEFIPPGYPEPDYPVDIEDADVEPNPNYIFKLLEENDRPIDNYEYKIVKKKNSRSESIPRKESAFRERSHHADNDKLKDLFAESSNDEKNDVLQDRAENDAEYALLLSQLWTKYKNNNIHGNSEANPQGIVKLYKEKVVQKRYPDNWGPVAFKRKRSPDSHRIHKVGRHPIVTQSADDENPSEPNYNAYAYEVSDANGRPAWGEDYAISFQPLSDDAIKEITDKNHYTEDTSFPMSKRSAGNYYNNQKKRFAPPLNNHEKAKTFRSSSGTDPRIIKDLSKIFGEVDIIKSPVKRNTDHEEPEPKPPQVTVMAHNVSHDHGKNVTHHDEDSHEQHGHSLHHPGLSGKEIENDHDHDHANHDHDHIKPKVIKKKSIDWSDYFGIDKRSKKIVRDVNQNRLRKQYFDTFNKEVIYPLNSFRKHTNVKRNYMGPSANEDTEIQISQAHEEKKDNAKDTETKLDNLDKTMKNVEGMIVDEALHYADPEEQIDSKEQQEVKEKMLKQLATAYSLEKMRKALKEFKQSLQAQNFESDTHASAMPTEEAKAKRLSVKKENVEMADNMIPVFNKGQDNNEDFEEEQGAGHYLNGKVEHYTEGYMGGSGRHRIPVVSTASVPGACPVLSKIVQRCHGVDLLAGDRGQLFLPLCSLHQICYLCGEAPPTTCDLVFLSEADTSCDGDMGCQRAARSALMALRELHDNLADEMDGECEANPCLAATLQLNLGWQRALQR